MRRAMAFLTPFGGARVPTPTTLGWFPAVGALQGLVLGGLWWGAARVWSPMLAAALVVAADLVVTGLLHFDGLVDAADGLLPPFPDALRRLEVMRTPTAGAFGVAAGAAVLLVRFAALASIRPSAWLLVAVWTLSRAAMAVGAVALPYARASQGGLATVFGGRLARRAAVAAATGGVALAVGTGLAWQPGHGAAALAVEALTAAAVLELARRRVGGYTGDVLGAAGVVAETLALVVAAAAW